MIIPVIEQEKDAYNYSLSLDRETDIYIYGSRQECYVLTNDMAMIARLDELCASMPKYYSVEDELIRSDGKTTTILHKGYVVKDKSLIIFGGGRILKDDNPPA